MRNVMLNSTLISYVILSAAVENGNSPVSRIDKMEGGFHKALLMTLDSGAELIAKIPCPNAGARTYSTATEVAVLEYRKRHSLWLF